jgi:hypothetical protein
MTLESARRANSHRCSGSFVDSAASPSASRIGDQVADRHALAQQPLQHAMQRAERELVGHDLLDQRRVRLLERLDHLLHVLAAEQLGGARLEHLDQVRRHDRRRLDDHVAVRLGLLTPRAGDPLGRHAERRVDRVHAVDLLHHAARVERQQEARHHLGPRDLAAAQLDHVLVARQPHVVADADGRDQDAQLQRALLAEQRDALQQVAALLLVDQRDERVADLELDGVDLQQVLHRVGRGRQRLDRRALDLLGLDRAGGDRLVGRAPERRGADGEHHEGHHGQPGDERERPQHAGRHVERAWMRAQLRGDHRADALVAAGRGDHDAGGGARDERRHLRHQAVADREQRVVGGGLGERQPALHDADEDAADDVDDRDQDGRDGVALHELGRAVHGAEEVGLARDLLAAAARLLLVDEPRAQVGVDGHLLAGHGVEREARGHLGHASGALRDHDEVDRDQDQEDDDADGEVAADDELAERLDDLARVPFAEDEARAGDVEPQPEEGADEQQRREGAELQRVGRVERHQQHHQREPDREREREVEQHRRQRHHEQAHHEHDRDGHAHLPLLPTGCGGGGGAAHAAALPSQPAPAR